MCTTAIAIKNFGLCSFFVQSLNQATPCVSVPKYFRRGALLCTQTTKFQISIVGGNANCCGINYSKMRLGCPKILCLCTLGDHNQLTYVNLIEANY